MTGRLIISHRMVPSNKLQGLEFDSVLCIQGG